MFDLLKRNNWAILLVLALFSCSTDEDLDVDMNDDEGYESYRYDLWKLFVDEGWSVDFVGTQVDDGTYSLYDGQSFDTDHEGIGGIETEGVLDNLEEVVNSIETPDIVLLCIGGNDLLGGDDPQETVDNVSEIIQRIHQLDPNIIVFVEQIAPARADIFTNEFQDLHSAFNNMILGLGNSVSPDLATVIPVDMSTNWKETFFADDVHYNELGASEVANRYFAAISSRLDAAASYKILPLGDSRVEGARP